MMTGDTDVTAGEAFVGGYSILRDMDKVRSSLGYCPQFDALDSLLTGKLEEGREKGREWKGRIRNEGIGRKGI